MESFESYLQRIVTSSTMQPPQPVSSGGQLFSTNQKRKRARKQLHRQITRRKRDRLYIKNLKRTLKTRKIALLQQKKKLQQRKKRRQRNTGHHPTQPKTSSIEKKNNNNDKSTKTKWHDIPFSYSITSIQSNELQFLRDTYYDSNKLLQKPSKNTIQLYNTLLQKNKQVDRLSYTRKLYVPFIYITIHDTINTNNHSTTLKTLFCEQSALYDSCLQMYIQCVSPYESSTNMSSSIPTIDDMFQLHPDFHIHIEAVSSSSTTYPLYTWQHSSQDVVHIMSFMHYMNEMSPHSCIYGDVQTTCPPTLRGVDTSMHICIQMNQSLCAIQQYCNMIIAWILQKVLSTSVRENGIEIYVPTKVQSILPKIPVTWYSDTNAVTIAPTTYHNIACTYHTLHSEYLRYDTSSNIVFVPSTWHTIHIFTTFRPCSIKDDITCVSTLFPYPAQTYVNDVLQSISSCNTCTLDKDDHVVIIGQCICTFKWHTSFDVCKRLRINGTSRPYCIRHYTKERIGTHIINDLHLKSATVATNDIDTICVFVMMSQSDLNHYSPQYINQILQEQRMCYVETFAIPQLHIDQLINVTDMISTPPSSPIRCKSFIRLHVRTDIQGTVQHVQLNAVHGISCTIVPPYCCYIIHHNRIEVYVQDT